MASSICLAVSSSVTIGVDCLYLVTIFVVGAVGATLDVECGVANVDGDVEVAFVGGVGVIVLNVGRLVSLRLVGRLGCEGLAVRFRLGHTLTPKVVLGGEGMTSISRSGPRSSGM